MIEATLAVTFDFDRDGNDNPREEEWGVIGLSCSPNVGDVVQVWHDRDYQWVRIDRVIHKAVALPLDESDRALKPRQEPFLHILAEWLPIATP